MFSAAKSAVRRMLSSKARQPPRAPENMTIYAVGDVHGRADLLAQVLTSIREDARETPGEGVVVFLGDYVDRGPASREVIDLLIEASSDEGLRWRFLRGNHDQSVLDFLYNPTTGMAWSDFGGRETLESYGVEVPLPWADRPAWTAAAEAFAVALPPAHLKFFNSLELLCELGDYLFVHAGVRPGVAIADQSERDLMWIREPFLSDPQPLSKVVVHGHTPSRAVHADGRRIGIDTGAYTTGILTVLRLRGEEGAIIQTEPPAQASAPVSPPDKKVAAPKRRRRSLTS
jgi:serine/threonine protein phosphatase 1